ncbi:MAG: lactate utilization protein [Sphingobacteriaceae bacterium]|jgi:L-lactate dehydrogenase complex protein LldG|nr:lactate utilization protein [Sphingobacteriaceae bacterium]
MSSREKILAAILANQPASQPYLDEIKTPETAADVVEEFKIVLGTIGGTCCEVADLNELSVELNKKSSAGERIISTIPEVAIGGNDNWREQDPHLLENVEVAVIRGHFGISENSAVWVTEELLHQRVLPFICQHLAIVLDKKEIVPTMHHAYERIAQAEYGFGTFIAGPSKTADIEQSLVLGAHGPKSLTVYLVG